jgi:hypothetical protein
MGRNLALAGVSLIVLLLLLETAFRALDLRGHFADRSRGYESVFLPEDQRLPGLFREFRPNSDFELRYDSDPRGYFGPSLGLRYHINRHGFRGPDWNPEKKPGTLRVMLLGDSFAFGEGVHWEDTLGERLEDLLAGRLSPAVEVLNVAVGGWGTRDEVIQLEQRGTYGADLVVLLYVLNDAGYPTGVDLWENFRHAYEPPDWLRHSYVLSFFYTRTARDILGRRYVTSLIRSGQTRRNDLWQQSFAGLARARDRVQDAGARFAVVLFPFLFELGDDYPFLVLHQNVRAACEAEGISFHDLLDDFKGLPYAELWVHPSDHHPNEIAHRRAAEAVARFLLSAGLLAPEGGSARMRPSSSSATAVSPARSSSAGPST